MSFVVPFDGTTLAEAGLVRASEYGNAMDEEIVVVTIVPERKRYAQKKGWIGEDEPYDVDAVVEQLRKRVQSLVPDATFDYEVIREAPPAEGIAARLESKIQEYDPAVVFLGSDNVGRIVTPLSSVGVHVATEDGYDIHLVREVRPPRIGFLDSHPDFYDESAGQ